jgi:hypothetical protein
MNTMDDHGAIFLLVPTKNLTTKVASTAMAMTAAEATAANS